MQGVRVRSLVRELRSHTPRGVAKKEEKKKRTKLLGRRVEILIFGTVPLRVSEIPRSDLSELSPMERRDDPGISSTARTMASEFQPDPNLSIPSLSPCHLHPSPIGTCTPTFRCLRKGREAPGCSHSMSQTYRDVFRMRLLSGGQNLS